MSEINESEFLAKIRTLLALERNFLAKERTALAEFRTGMALTVAAPTASTIVVYVISFIDFNPSIFFEILNFTFFSILTIIGLWISYKARIKLKKIRQKKVQIKNKTLEISKSSKEIFSLLRD